MKEPEKTYPALYIIFTLLNTFRRGIERKNIWREFRRQKITLCPRLSFWIPLCREAGLLEENERQIRVTRHARQWLNKTPEDQTFLLIEAWQNAPKNHSARRFRRKLLWKLKHDQPLTAKDLCAMKGLEALGLSIEENLTRWGRFFIKGEGALPTPKPTKACAIQGDDFIAPVEQHIDLLWELEEYLRPISPGRYRLTNRALHFFSGDPYELIHLLERGLQKEISSRTKAGILRQPSLKIMNGLVIEFSSPSELKQLRKQPNFRQYIEQYLSPTHILVSSTDAPRLMKMLERHGVYVTNHQEAHAETPTKRTHFSRKFIPVPGGKAVPKMEVLEKYMQLQQALDILYRAPGYPAEQRRITPISIEQRGEHTYIIAHCQARRAQRTFRLDRMEIPGTF
jgi:hypothetical protein